MKKLKCIFVCLLALISAGIFSSCKTQEEEQNSYYTPPITTGNAPQIINMNFAASETAYTLNNYIDSSASDTSFYLGFTVSDEDKDITEIHLTVKNAYGLTIQNGSRILTVSNMTSKTWTGGIAYSLSGTGTFTFSAYAEDSAGNKSLSLERSIFVSDAPNQEETNGSPQIINMNFAATESKYALDSYITEIEQNTEFYLGFQIKDEDKDITKIHLTIKNASGQTIQNGSRILTVSNMTSKTWTGGITYSLSGTGTFTFSAYAEDGAENKSLPLERSIFVLEAQNQEETNSSPQIINMNFAASETAYTLGNYIDSSASDISFYLGFTVSDEDKDITKIHLTVKNAYGLTIQNGSRILTVSNMTSKTWTGGIAYSLSGTGTFTFSAYAEDSQGNKSSTVEKSISLTSALNTFWNETTSVPASSYKAKQFILYRTATLSANVTCMNASGVKIYLLDKENYDLFAAGKQYNYYSDLSSSNANTTAFNKSAAYSAGTYYFVIKNDNLLTSKTVTVLLTAK